MGRLRAADQQCRGQEDPGTNLRFTPTGVRVKVLLGKYGRQRAGSGEVEKSIALHRQRDP